MTRKKTDEQKLFTEAVRELGIDVPVRKTEMLPNGSIKLYTRNGAQVYTPPPPPEKKEQKPKAKPKTKSTASRKPSRAKSEVKDGP